MNRARRRARGKVIRKVCVQEFEKQVRPAIQNMMAELAEKMTTELRDKICCQVEEHLNKSMGADGTDSATEN